MKRSLIFRLCYLGLAGQLLCQPGKLFADKSAPETTPAERPKSEYNLQIIEGQLVRSSSSIEATLANVVDALRDEYTQANIVLSPGLAKLKVGDLKLRAGHLTEELEAVRVASGERFDVQGSGRSNSANTPQRVDPNTGLAIPEAASMNSGLFVLREAPPTAQSRKIVEAFNIGPYLEWLVHRPPPDRIDNPEAKGLEEIYRVLNETIRDFQGDSNPDVPKCQYHHGATLLVVIGTVESVEIARKIVNALPGMSLGSDQARVARFGVESGGGQPPPQTSQQRAAEDAFRARYGLARRPTPTDPATQAPESGAAK